MAEGENIIPINIEEEMKTAYIDYSMSVIVSRAIPDVRDGLKPVHRRVLYAMQDLGLASNRAYKKSARIVGEVLGKYHPHGDSSVYDAMVRMAQTWSLRYPLVDGQGNFGSVDGDSPAAMRYTEARLKKIAEEMLTDIDKDTVDFGLNFDDTLKEPEVLPSRIPNLLVNGASGIAVGMATNILPHNLTEVIDGTIAYIDDNDITIENLMQFVKAPDFPTGGTIYGYDGVKEAFMTGRGKVVVRGKAEIIENEGEKSKIIVNEIPYQVNKASLIMKAADLVNEKKIEGISDIRDESDRKGMRIVFDLKRDANPDVVLNKLYNFTPLQTSYGVNNIALVKGRPQLINLKDFIHNFVEFRHEILVRRTKYELAEAEKKAHILEGLLIALDHLDAVIKLIRESDTPDTAKNGLISNFKLTEVQAKAILEMRLQRLTGLERDKIKQDYEELMKQIEYFKEILADEGLRMKIIKEELEDIKKKYGDERRTDIVMAGDDINIEDLIADEDFVITISHMGYIKRTQIDEYRTQNRGGRGSRGGKTREEDFIEYIFIASAHQYILFFTDKGQVYWLRVYEIPEGNKTSKGRPIQNLVNIPKEDRVNTFINVRDLEDEEALDNQFVVLCTKKGVIKKTTLRAYSRPRVTGIRAINVRDGDQLLGAKLTDGSCDIMMAVKSGKAIRFPESKVRPMGRTASGVRGVKLSSDKDEVVGMICVTREEMDFAIAANEAQDKFYEKNGDDAELPDDINENLKQKQTIMVVAEKGYGKRSDIEEYRITNRGGVGVKTINVTDKTGSLIAIKNVTDHDDVMIINKSGITIRMSLDNVRVMGRATQGVRLIKLDEGDEIASVAKVAYVNGEEDEVDESNDAKEVDDSNDAKEGGEESADNEKD